MENDIGGSSWSDRLGDLFTYGASALIDSQLRHDYSAGDPRYSTERGIAGQPQTPTGQALAFGLTPTMLLLGAVVVVAAILLSRK